MAEAIGGLHAELSANSATFVDHVNKARSASRGLANELRSNLAKSNAKASSSGRVVAREAKKTGKAMRGLQGSIAAAGSSMRALGSSAGGQVAELAGSFAGLQSGVGAVGVALIAVTATVFAAKSGLALLRAENDKVTASLHRQIKAGSRLKAIWDERAKAAEAAEAERRGVSVDVLRVDKELEAARTALRSARRLQEAQRREAAEAAKRRTGLDLVWQAADGAFDLSGAQEAADAAHSLAANAHARIGELEKVRTRLLEEESRRRVEAERKETEGRLAEARRFHLSIRSQVQSVDERRIGALGGGTPLDRQLRAAGLREIKALGDAREEGGPGLREREAMIRMRFRRERALLQDLDRKRVEDRRKSLEREGRVVLDQVEAIGRDSLAAELRALRTAREHALEAAREKGEDVAAVARLFHARETLARRRHAHEQAEQVRSLQEEIAQAAAGAAFEVEQIERDSFGRRRAEVARFFDGLGKRAREAGVDTAAIEGARASRLAVIAREEADERVGLREDLDERLRTVEAGAAARLAALSMTETEQRLAEVNRRYDEEIRTAREKGATLADVERLNAARRLDASAVLRDPARLAEEQRAAIEKALAGDDLLEGFEVGLGQAREGLASFGELGASIARDLSSGLGSMFTGAIKGAEDLGERLERLAEQIADTVLSTAIGRLVGAAFTPAAGKTDGGGSTGTTDVQYAGARARGGSWVAKGAGGIDSQLMMARVSPGERVDFTPPGRQHGGGGDVHVHVNGAPSTPSVRQRRSPGRRDIYLDFEEKMASRAGAGRGPLARTLQTRYGVGTVPTRR